MKTFLPISSELESKFKNCDSEIQAFVDALQLELMKLHKKNLSLEANNVSLNARINVLEGELQEYNESKQSKKNFSEFSPEDLKTVSDIFKKYRTHNESSAKEQ